MFVPVYIVPQSINESKVNFIVFALGKVNANSEPVTPVSGPKVYELEVTVVVRSNEDRVKVIEN